MSGRGPISNSSDDKLREVQRKADEVAAITRANIQQSLSQVDSLHEMETKAEILEQSGRNFHKNAQQIRRKFCFQYYRLTFMILVVVAIIIIILYFSIKSKVDSSS